MTNLYVMFTLRSYSDAVLIIPMQTPAADPSICLLPVFSSRVPAGFPSPAEDHVEGKLDLNQHLIRRPAATFFVRASGESMRDAGIFDGDLLVIDRSLTPQVGDVVIAVVRGDLTVKRLARAGRNAWRLAAANAAFPDIPVDEDGCEIWGVVTNSIRRHCRR